MPRSIVSYNIQALPGLRLPQCQQLQFRAFLHSKLPATISERSQATDFLREFRYPGENVPQHIHIHKWPLLRKEYLFVPSQPQKVKATTRYGIPSYFDRVLSTKSPESSWSIKENLRVLQSFQSYQHVATALECLIALNAIVERCHLFSIELPLVLVYLGLEIAARNNCPNIMPTYLRLIPKVTIGQSVEYSIALQHCASIARGILDAKKGIHRKSWKGRRQKEAWANLLVGSDNILYHMFSTHGVAGLSYYFQLIEKFCSSKQIEQCWIVDDIHHQRMESLCTDVGNFILNSFIQILIRKGNPQFAWQLASTPGNCKISDQTLKMLFHHPEHLPAWKPIYQKPAMAALEKYAKEIERQLGVIWTGGENGSHEAKSEGLQVICQ